jgi:endonuclease YncB( thermonuclease family)
LQEIAKCRPGQSLAMLSGRVADRAAGPRHWRFWSSSSARCCSPLRLDPLPADLSGRAVASDGDSLRVGSERVRLLGLDAPELDQTCWREDGSEWACGREARDLMVRLLHAGAVNCAPEGIDRFGRSLARCEAAGRDIAAAMVEAGLAVARDGYGAEESRARSAGRGIWAGRFTDPRQWRDEGPSDDPGPGVLEKLWKWLRELTGARSLR